MDIKEKDESIQQRLEIMIQLFANGNKSAFGRQADIQSGVLAGLVGGRMNNPSFSVLQKIATAFPQVQVEWLLLGTGKMLKSDADPDILLECLESVRFLLMVSYTFTDLDKARSVLRNLREYQNRLNHLKPAYEAINTGVYQIYDKKSVDGYKGLKAELKSKIDAIAVIEADLIEENQIETEASTANESSEKLPKKAIEVEDSSGRQTFVLLNAISHVYSLEADGKKAVIELITVGEKGNKVINTLQSYRKIKRLITTA